MFKSMVTRIRQGHRTMKFPHGAPPAMPDRFRGRPVAAPDKCASCDARSGRGGAGEGIQSRFPCAEACPTGALSFGKQELSAGGGASDGKPAASIPMVDLGKCLFCTDCSKACPSGAISHSSDYRLSTSGRMDLVVPAGPEPDVLRLASALRGETLRLYGRSLRLREVSAGGCNACEADVNVLGTIGWDLGRFGIQMVASPRHADGILVTGPVTRNMELALRKTWDALPEPRIAIAVGSCAISGGPFAQGGETLGGLSNPELGIPVDLWVPGCPPHPLTILDGLLRLLGRIRG